MWRASRGCATGYAIGGRAARDCSSKDRWGSACDGWRSWTWPEAASRWPTRTARYASSSTARFTTTRLSVRGSRRAGIGTEPEATRRQSSISMKRKGSGASSASRGCSRSPCGIGLAGGFSWRGTLEERAAQVRARLAAAVRSHLMSDVPLGLFLSGGIDSSALAALMAPMVREPIRTFAVGFADPGANELAYARLAAASVGAEHREVVVSPSQFFDALPNLVWHEDEPIAFPSSVALYFVSRLAREHVKVVLTGEGADELFLGYNRYRVTAWNKRLGRAYWALVPGP